MLQDAETFSGFSVDDAAAARRFYSETLGLKLSALDEANGLYQLELPEGHNVLVYVSGIHSPASYTVLNFKVDDAEAVVDGLTARGVRFERYDQGEGGLPPGAQDAKGIMRAQGPLIAWFKDPAGNVLSVLQER
jgi:catechol 2,3-dioxygenase-like lactoylglutathione lyase family enzyme